MPPLPKRLERRLREGVKGMTALIRRPAFLILVPTSNMTLRSPYNCVPLSRTVLLDKNCGGAVSAPVGRAVPARIGSVSEIRELQVINRNYSDL